MTGGESVREKERVGTGPGVNPTDAIFRLRTVVGGHPSLYFPLAVRLGFRKAPFLVNRDSDIVIEGFPRSANSFAVYAFEKAQGRPVVVAHHRHVAAQLIRGKALGLPLLLLVRQPVAAVASLCVFSPGISPRTALRCYATFHRQLWPHAPDLCVATFEEVIEDFGTVTKRVNRKYGSTFRCFRHDAANTKSIFDEMERTWPALARGVGLAGRRDRYIPRPFFKKDNMKEPVIAEIGRTKNRRFLQDAENWYTRFASLTST